MTAARARGGWRAAALAAPVLLFGLLYARALDHGFVWMDEREIVGREIVVEPAQWASAFTRPLHASQAAGFDELRSPYYRPLQILLVSAVAAGFGPSPRAFRAAGFVLAAATLALFGAFVTWLSGSAAAGALAAAIVAAHPVSIEPFVWISAISDTLGALFGSGALFAALLAAREGGRGRAALATSSWLALVLALFSKEKSVVLPGLLALAFAGAALAARRAPEGRAPRFAPRAAVALVVVHAVTVALYALVWRPLLLGSALAHAAPIGGGVVSHLATAIGSWPRSLGWLLVPVAPTTSDSVRVIVGFGDAAPWLGGLLALGSAALAAFALFRGRWLGALGIAWIWVAFLPTANLLPQIHARADRYLFLSAFGLALVAADLCAAVSLRRGWGRPLGVGAAALGLAALALLTSLRLPDWRSTRALFERDVAGDPSFLEGRHHLAIGYAAEGRFAEAEAQLREILAATGGAATRHGNVNRLGVYELACQTRLALRRPADALAFVAELGARDPRLAKLPNLRTCAAQAKVASGRRDEAVGDLLALASELPGAPPARFSALVARVLAESGRAEEARAWIARAESAPDRDPALVQELAQVRALLRRPATAAPSPSAPAGRPPGS